MTKKKNNPSSKQNTVRFRVLALSLVLLLGMITLVFSVKNLSGLIRASLENIGQASVTTKDSIAPELATRPMVFAAKNNKSVTLSFSDQGSGVALVKVRVSKPDGTAILYSVANNANLTFTHDFSQAKSHTLQYYAEDNTKNNTGWRTMTAFFRVVAAVPEWDVANCTGDNYENTCPSRISWDTTSCYPSGYYYDCAARPKTTSDLVVADGEAAHLVIAELVDRYGNRVVPIDGVKSVGVEFRFNNNTVLDQIKKTGDAARLRVLEANLNLKAGTNDLTRLTTTGVLQDIDKLRRPSQVQRNKLNTPQEKYLRNAQMTALYDKFYDNFNLIDYTNPAYGELTEIFSLSDGKYVVAVSSYAPTYEGDAILGEGSRLGFRELDYTVTGLGGLTGIGEASSSKTQEYYFAFAPVSEKSSQVLGFMTESGDSSEPMIFAAEQSKKITLKFDASVALAEVKISKPDGSLAGYTVRDSRNLVFTHDFSKAGLYALQYHTIDTNGIDSGWQTIAAFFQVLAAVPEWDAANCTGNNYENTCPSATVFSTGARVADGQSTHFVLTTLVDRYGNRVVPIDGVKSVAMEFKFNNTTALDQVAGTGDAAVLRIPFVATLLNSAGHLPKLNSTGSYLKDIRGSHVFVPNSKDMTAWDKHLRMEQELNRYKQYEKVITYNYADRGTDYLALRFLRDGQYLVEVSSYTPTYEGYSTVGSDFRLGFKELSYKITGLENYNGVGETSGGRVKENYFAFTPALTATPQAVGGENQTPAEAAKEVAIGQAKRFLVGLSDKSTTKNYAYLQLGLKVQSDNADVVWGDAALEKSHGVNVATPLKLVTGGTMTSIWNTIPPAANSVNAGDTKYLIFKSTPKALTGDVKSNFGTVLKTYVRYLSLGNNFASYPTDQLALGSTSNIVNQAIEAKLQVLGASNLFSTVKLDGQTINPNMGDAFRSEFRSALIRNLAPYVNNAVPVSKICDNENYTINSSNWETFSCKSSSGNVLYFQGADVTLDDAALLTLPTGKKTIIIKGGNVRIKSNLVYGAATDSFGIILLKNDNKNNDPLDDGGNLLIYPNVTNLALALYAEGSVISVDNTGAFDRFADRQTELSNQLYWQGSLVAQNTLGGSDMNPTICPSQITTACTSRNRAFARVFDLNYLRTFDVATGGLRAGGLNAAGVDTDSTLPDPPDGIANNYAFIIKYDTRIKTNPPPLFTDISI